MKVDKKTVLPKLDMTYNFTFENKREDNTPTDEELELIKKYYKKATKENVYVFEGSFCNTIFDRQQDVFTDESIEILANTAVGKSILIDHDTTKRCGKIFKSYVENVEYKQEGTEVSLYNVKTGFIVGYIPRIKKNEQIIDELETGIVEFTSPGFQVARYECPICGKNLWGENVCEHYPGKTYNGQLCYQILHAKETNEVSLVYLGAQYGTQSKGYIENPNINKEVKEKMDFEKMYNDLLKDFEDYKAQGLEKSLEDANSKYDELNKSYEETKTLVAELESRVKIFGEDVSVEELNEIKSFSEIGKTEKANIIATLKKNVGLLNSATGKVVLSEKSLEAICSNCPYDELKAMNEDYANLVKSNIPTGRATEKTNTEGTEESSKINYNI